MCVRIHRHCSLALKYELYRQCLQFTVFTVFCNNVCIIYSRTDAFLIEFTTGGAYYVLGQKLVELTLGTA